MAKKLKNVHIQKSDNSLLIWTDVSSGKLREIEGITEVINSICNPGAYRMFIDKRYNANEIIVEIKELAEKL